MELKTFKTKIKKSFSTESQQRIFKAISLSEKLYKGIERKDGSPQLNHVLNISARIVETLVDEDSVISSFLYHALQRKLISKQNIEKTFGKTVLLLSSGVADFKSKTGFVQRDSLDRFNVKKLLLASTSDIRILIIRLADRVENILSAGNLDLQQRFATAEKTQKVYAPLAGYIGVYKWQSIMQDEAFRILEPDIYESIKSQISDYLNIKEVFLSKVQKELETLVGSITASYKVKGRMKGVFSINKKIKKYEEEGFSKEFVFDAIQDKFAFRILVEKTEDCYKLLKAITSVWPIYEKFYRVKDYIRNPKPNGYRSLQFPVLVEKIPLEMQIRTFEMHDYNEYGPASHIAYKLSGKRLVEATTEYDWIRDLVKWQEEGGVQQYKLSLFDDYVYVYSPRGSVLEFPVNSTPLDFAYQIHADVGNNCESVKINGRKRSLSTKLKTGDVIEIIKSEFPKDPSEDWLNMVVTKRARHAINKGLRKNEKQKNYRVFN